MIGAGGVATVAAFKIVQNQDVFTEFMIASRRKEKCDKLVKDIHAKGYKMDIQTAEVDADDVEQLKALFNSYKPELVINLALPYQDLTIMDACLACGCNYMDTANYEPKDEAHFEYSWQWAYNDKYEKGRLCANQGCRNDPGVSANITRTPRDLMPYGIPPHGLESRPLRYPRLRFRPRRFRYLHRIRCQTSLR